jgi:Leucine-rich repeat (LRR) protein
MEDIEIINEINRLFNFLIAGLFSSGYFSKLEQDKSGSPMDHYSTDNENNIIEFKISVRYNSFLKIPFFDQFALLCKLLKKLKNLQTLIIENTYGLNLSHIKQLTQLSELKLSGCCITDIRALSELKQLTKLYLDENLITDVSPLANLERLEVLDLSRNRIVDLNPLSKLKQLKELILRRNRISDIEPLNEFNQLEILNLEENLITDINPFRELIQFKKVMAGKNPLNELPFWWKRDYTDTFSDKFSYDNRIYIGGHVHDESKVDFGLPSDTLPYLYNNWKRKKFPYIYKKGFIRFLQ